MDQIKKIIDLGVLVEPDAVDSMKKLSNEDLSIIISKTERERPLVLSDSLIKHYLKKTNMIILKQQEPKNSFSVQNLVDEINERYSFLQKILLGKINTDDMVSINKCGVGKASVIGMVMLIEEKDDTFVVEVEDTTGSIKSVIQKEKGKKIEKDDVIAITGNVNNGILFADTVVFPDVPLRQPTRSEYNTKVGIMIDHDFSKIPDIDADYLIIKDCKNIDNLIKELPFVRLIIFGNTETKAKKVNHPCIMNIDGVVILVAFGIDPLSALKKRYILHDSSFFAIEPVPDILFTDKSVDATQENYKGISIVQNFSAININNREVKKISRL